MIMRSWSINKADRNEVIKCSKEWNIPEISAEILISRGFKDKDEVLNFLNLPEFFDPFHFTDMEKAIKYLNLAIENHEKICVYGDYDADGVTATALVYSYLKSKNADVIYYIPSREKEGYGLNISAVENLHSRGVKLLLTVDNGISSVEEVDLAVRLGMKVIITDHHQLPEKLPNAHAIINPCRETWISKDNNFSGVGVAYKLVQAIEKREDYLDFAVLGTIGDSMPLFGQSRRILKKGLKSISDSKIVGIRVLMESLKLLGKSICSSDLTFKTVPRINASGRIESAETVLELLVNEDESKCRELCVKLENLNTSRKSIEKEIMDAVEEEIRKDPKKKYENVIVVSGENWHHGVIGIVASKIVGKYGKPCILISFSGDEARGSCRSVEDFSIYDLISSCSEHLERFGGHTLAAGISLKTEKLKSFTDAIIENVKNTDLMFPKLSVDLQLSSFSLGMVKALSYLEPFGNGNPEPTFCILNLKLERIIKIGGEKHLKLYFQNENGRFEMLYFNKSFKEFLYNQGDILDVAFTIHENVFRTKSTVSAYIVDLKPSSLDIETAISSKILYEKFKRNETLSTSEVNSLIPSRDDFAKVYRFIVRNPKRLRPDILSQKVFGNTENVGKIYVILDVLEQMNLIKVFWYADEFCFEIKKSEGKVSLENSEVLKLLNKAKGVKENE